MAVDKAKLDGVKDYLRRAKLTPEETGELIGWMMLDQVGNAIKEATEE